MRTNTTRFVAVTAIALALGGTALGTAAVANAGTMPTDGPTVAMTITNNTDNPMLLDSASNPYGQWINGPRSYLAPDTTEIVTAYSSDPRGIGVDVTYNVADLESRPSWRPTTTPATPPSTGPASSVTRRTSSSPTTWPPATPR